MLTFGLIADIQHAPIPDGFSFGGVPRYYKHALDTAKVAAKDFSQQSCDFAVNIGDTIDGKCGDDTIANGALSDVVDNLGNFQNGEWYGIIGNHELYNFGRKRWGSSMFASATTSERGINCQVSTENNADDIEDNLVGYYSFDKEDFRFIVVDCYDITSLKRSPTSEKGKLASDYLSKNPNEEKNSPVGLQNLDQRFVAFNGAVGANQLIWLRNMLQKSVDEEKKVIILSHVPFYPPIAPPTTLCWNYDEVLNLFGEFKNVIKATLCGHTHTSCYEQVRDGEERSEECSRSEATSQQSLICSSFSFSRLIANMTCRTPTRTSTTSSSRRRWRVSHQFTRIRLLNSGTTT